MTAAPSSWRPEAIGCVLPFLNCRSKQLIGHVVALHRAIEAGIGQMRIDKAHEAVTGPELLQVLGCA